MAGVLSKEDLVLYIKRALGYPTVNVELTDDQIDIAIDDAIGEIQPWYTSFRYLTINASMAIDLSEYSVLEVTDVFKVLESGSSKSQYGDPFYDQSLINQGMLVVGLGGSYGSYGHGSRLHKIAAKSDKLNTEIFHQRLANVVRMRIAGDFKDNISYRFIDDILYLDTGVPSSEVVTIEYIPKVMEVEDFVGDERFNRYLKDLSLAYCNVMMARVVGKYSTSSAPITINHNRMYDSGISEIDRIRKDLRDTAMTQFITD